MTLHFYRDLRGFDRFSQLTDPQHYIAAPAEWHLLTADIEGSTRALSEGRYKEINLVGAAVVMSVLNIAGALSLPYVFGGDGASFLVPAELVVKSREVLGAVQSKADAMFRLKLRAGSVLLETIYASGGRLEVAKFNLSPHVSQAFFKGTGLSVAERWLKSGSDKLTYCLPSSEASLDLQGLECRWQPIKSRKGTIITLVVKAVAGSEEAMSRIYADVFEEMAAIYPDDAQASPAYAEGIRLSMSPRALTAEARIRSRGSIFGQVSYLVNALAQNAIGQFSFLTGKSIGAFNGKRYLSQLIANSDYRKFDEMLRMVLDSTPMERDALEAMLERRRRSGEIVYGLQFASEALMTCLIFNRENRHVHFVDGAGGGYALATLQMKQQLAEITSR